MSNEPPDSVTKASIWYYAVAALVFLAGLGWFVVSLGSLDDALTQVIIPGQSELTLTDPGEYAIYHEYRSVVAGKIYSTVQEDISGLRYSLTSKATGEEIRLSRPSTRSTYSLSGPAGVREGVSMLQLLSSQLSQGFPTSCLVSILP